MISAGRWKHLGGTAEELREVGERLARSKRKEDAAVASKVSSGAATSYQVS